MTANPTPSVDNLVSRIQSGGGALRITSPQSTERAAWRRTIHAALNGGGLPAGLRLRYSGRDSGDLVIRLVSDTEENQPQQARPALVQVPARLPNRPHSVVTATRDVAHPGPDGWIDTRRRPMVAHLFVAKANLPRALRLLQGLVVEAERRGYRIVTAAGHGHCAGGMGIQIDGQVLEVVISEERTRVALQPTDTDQSRKGGYHWGPRWEYLPTGRLRLRVGHDGWGPALATDRQRWRIEDRLGHAFQRLESMAAEARARQLEREALAAQRRAAEQAEAEAGLAREAEARRVRDLVGEVQAWRLAGDIRAFVAEARANGLTNKSREPEWLDWALQYAANIDPVEAGAVGDTPVCRTARS